MLILGTELFAAKPFSNESELESIVEKHHKLLFGNDAIFLSKKMLVKTGEGRGTIPDAFVVDCQNDEWYMVEVELIAHGVWRHIVPQITNQIVACLNQSTRDLLTDRVLEYISADSRLATQQGIQQKVVAILRKEPIIAIPIDGTSPDLETWSQTQKLQVSIWVIQKLESLTEPGRIAYQIPSDNEPSIVTKTLDQSVATVQRAYTKYVATLIESGLLADGEELILNYRGKQFCGKARANGVELSDGNTYSPSDAAIRCYSQAGSARPTENGWRVWKNKRGMTLNELFDRSEILERV